MTTRFGARTKPMEFVLQLGRFYEGVGINERLDHSLEDFEQLGRCGLGRHLRPIVGDDFVPVCLLQIERDVVFTPRASEHFEVVEWSVGGRLIAHCRPSRQSVDSDIRCRAIYMQQPEITGAAGRTR